MKIAAKTADRRRTIITILVQKAHGFNRGMNGLKKKGEREMQQIKIPDEMLKAANEAVKIPISGEIVRNQVHDILQAALRWLSENPIVPTQKQLNYISAECKPLRGELSFFMLFREWQRRQFLAPEPEVPEAIKDLLYQKPGTRVGVDGDPVQASRYIAESDRRVLESHLRGMEEAAKLFSGLSWGPYYPPDAQIRARIKAYRLGQKAQKKSAELS